MCDRSRRIAVLWLVIRCDTFGGVAGQWASRALRRPPEEAFTTDCTLSALDSTDVSEAGP